MSYVIIRDMSPSPCQIRSNFRPPIPSPTYLAIHAACAKVAHLSGAAECINKFYRDMEDGMILDPNEASAEMLECAIFEL